MLFSFLLWIFWYHGVQGLDFVCKRNLILPDRCFGGTLGIHWCENLLTFGSRRGPCVDYPPSKTCFFRVFFLRTRGSGLRIGSEEVLLRKDSVTPRKLVGIVWVGNEARLEYSHLVYHTMTGALFSCHPPIVASF